MTTRQLGSADAAMIVRDPVIADVALPRFLAPGDTAQLAVSLHNTDGVPGAYHLALTASGAATPDLPGTNWTTPSPPDSASRMR